MPSTFTFSTIPEGLNQLSTSLSLVDVMNYTRQGCVDDLLALLRKLPEKSTPESVLNFKEYNHMTGKDAKTWITYLTPKVGDIYYLNSAVLFPDGIKGDADLVQAAQWEEVLESLKEFQRADQSFKQHKNEYHTLGARIGEMAKAEKGAKQLVGTYVFITTSRRHVHGWVLSGRGNTAHILPDPWGGLEGREQNTPPNIDQVYEEHLTEQKMQEYRLDAVNQIKVVLPWAEAQQRRVLNQTWVKNLNLAKAEAATAWEDRKVWEESGGKAAKDRLQKIIRIRTNLTPIPKMNYYSSDEQKIWFKAALELAGAEAVREHAIKIAVDKDAGGALTPAELDVLAKEPTHIPATLKEVWEQKWNERINPPKKTEEQE